MGVTEKCPSCSYKLSVLREAGSPPKLVCRRCHRQVQPQRDGRPICPVCGIAALYVLALPDQPGKLLFVHNSGEIRASGHLVDAPGFEAVKA